MAASSIYTGAQWGACASGCSSCCARSSRHSATRRTPRRVLPTGLIYNDVGDVVLDPDAQIRETITHFFDTFARVGSACQTVKAFSREALHFPSRAYNRNKVVFQP